MIVQGELLCGIMDKKNIGSAMGDKASAKVRMRAAGVPVVPGFDGDDPTDDQLVEAAAAVGYPLLVKATAGGGGRGMRIVRRPAQAALAQGARVLLNRA